MAHSKKKKDGRIVLALADVHGGHDLALCNPESTLIRSGDDGKAFQWQPELTTTQKRLWSAYQNHLRAAVEFAAGREIVALHVGDLTWGGLPNGPMNLSPMDQLEIGIGNLIPLLNLPNVKKLRILSGTMAHVPDSIEARAAHIMAERTGKDVQAAHHERIDIEGVVFDVAHHGPSTGGRDWLKGNIARWYLQSAVAYDRRIGAKPSRVYLRGHYHNFCWVTVHEIWKEKQCAFDLMVLPAYSGLTWFARKVTQSTPSVTVGLALFEIIAGELREIAPRIETWDLRVMETI